MRPALSASLAVVLLALAAPAAAQFEPVPTPAPEPVAAPETPSRDPSALRDPALYVGETELLSQAPGERRAAVARALAQVVVKLTGRPEAAANPVVRRALAGAQSYVLAEQDAPGESDQQGNTAIGGVPVLKTTLRVEFDPERVDALVAAAGLPRWGHARPRPILWLAIDDGRGARLVNAGQVNVVKPLASRGTERGLSFGLPAGSAVEQAAVDTVWALNPGPLQPLTERYGHSTQLLGKLYRAGGGWTADWVLSRGDSELARWSFTDPSPQRAIASGADGAADAIARRDAVADEVGEPAVHEVLVTGLADGPAFLRAMGYLQTLPLVRGLEVLEATPDSLRLRLDLAVGVPAFDAFLAAGDTLAGEPAAPGAPATYRLK